MATEKKTDYRLMQVKSIVLILSTFIKLPFVIKIRFYFVYLFKTGFTVATCRVKLYAHA